MTIQPSDYPLLELLYAALREPLGLCITAGPTTDAFSLQKRLTIVRLHAEDSALDALTFTRSRENPNTEVWVIRKPGTPPHDPSVDLDAELGEEGSHAP